MSFVKKANSSPPAKRSNILTKEAALSKKFGFTPEETQRVLKALDDSNFAALSLAKMALPIKGLGFLRSEIVEIVEILGESALDKENWVAVSGLKKYTKNVAIAFSAYRAGLTVEDVKNMSEEELSEENLEVLINLKNF